MIKREMLPGRSGYAIPCLHTLAGREQMVCIVAHGFGSGKDGETSRRLLKELPAYGIGVLAFDFPGHGESPADSRLLAVERCLDDLAVAEDRARQLCPAAEIVYFGSSFGGYATLHYLASRPHAGKKAFLRSAAVEMPAIYRQFLELARRVTKKTEDILVEEGYDRPLWMTDSFAADLAAHSVFSAYRPGTASLAMAHGQEDDVASPEAAKRFAAEKGAKLMLFPGEGHRLDGPGTPERVIRMAVDFYNS